MKSQYATLGHVRLSAGTSFTETTEAPPMVDLESPARSVMTSFREIHPLTVDPHAPIDDALDAMKAAGVRLLFVVDEDRRILGLITAKDIMGEKPIKLANESRIAHTDIQVEMIMTPQSRVSVLTQPSIDGAQVGHIVATLRALETRHLLVVSTDSAQTVIGLFSASEIGKRTGLDLSEELAPAHSLAELVQSIG